MRWILPASLALIAGGVSAQTDDDRKLAYRENMEGVYFQDWYVAAPQIYAGGISTATIIGEGKQGDFQGDLYIDCRAPENSKWLSVDGTLYLKANQVPLEAILAVRSQLCVDS